jgi:succinate dehydrogenase/fumarate reductase-like Fe-S protein
MVQLALPKSSRIRTGETCPKGLNPATAIAEIKKLMAKRRV